MKIIAGALLILFSSSAMAEKSRFTLELMTGSENTTLEQAQKYEHSQDGFVLDFAMHATYKYFRAGIGITERFMKNYNKNTVNVSNYYGETGTRTNSVSYTSLYAEAGPSIFLFNTVQLNVNFGAQTLWGSRSYNDCTDCGSESFETTGGLYIRPSAEFILYKEGSGDFIGGLGASVSHKTGLGESTFTDGWRVGANVMVAI